MSIKGKEILIIDDVADQRVLVRRVLENAGISVLEADSVEQALAILAKRSPHLLLLDLQMPKVSGFDFLEKRQAMTSLQSVPVIVTSGLKDTKSIYRAISLGASDYLVKPLASPILLRKIRKQLKDTEFHSFQYLEDEMPIIQASIQTEITKATATSFNLFSLIRIAPETPMRVQGKEMADFGLSDCTFVTGSAPLSWSSTGIYRGLLSAKDKNFASPSKTEKRPK